MILNDLKFIIFLCLIIDFSYYVHAQSNCVTQASYRHYGGGFGTGTAADGIAPYPTTTATAALCATSCQTAGNCRSFVWEPTTTSCWRHTTPYTGTQANISYTSGTCGICTVSAASRHWGGTYMTGVASEQIAPYPLNVTTIQECSDACLSVGVCQTFVFWPGFCYRFTSTYTGSTYVGDALSGTCNMCNYTGRSLTFMSALSTVSDLDSNGLQDIRLVFAGDRGYTNVDFAFVGASTRCNSPVRQTGTWNIDNSSISCNRTFTFTSDLNQALQYCNFDRLEGLKSTNLTTYRTTVLLTSTAWMRVIRNVNITASFQTSVSIDLDFNNFVQTTSNNLTVYSGVDPSVSSFLLARVITQSYDVATATLSLLVLTSASWPYQVSFGSLSPNANWVVSAVANQFGPSATGTSNITARCDDGSLGPVAGLSGVDGTYNAGNPCTQYWRVSLRRVLDCPIATTLIANWSMNFTVGCHALYTGSCAITAGSPSSIASVAFDTASDNVCPVLLDVETVQPTVVFSDSTSGTQQTNEFPVGTRSSVNVRINSPIRLEHTLIERITIVSGGPTPNLVIYTNLLADVGNVNANQRPCRMSANNCTTGRFNISGRATNLSPTLLLVDDLPNGNPNTSVASWIWSNFTAATSGDAPTAVLVRAEVRVRFANQNTASDRRFSVLTHAKTHLLSNNEQIGAAEGVVFISAANNDNGNNANDNVNNANDNNNSNSNNISGNTNNFGSLQVFGVVGAVIGVLGAISAAAVFMKMKNRERKDSAKNTTF